MTTMLRHAVFRLLKLSHEPPLLQQTTSEQWTIRARLSELYCALLCLLCLPLSIFLFFFCIAFLIWVCELRLSLYFCVFFLLVVMIKLILQMTNGLKSYIRDRWNIVDQGMYIILLVAVILRFTTTNDTDFVAARYVYAVDLVIFYLRILQLYYINKRLGPKVVVIFRMVRAVNY